MLSVFNFPVDFLWKKPVLLYNLTHIILRDCFLSDIILIKDPILIQSLIFSCITNSRNFFRTKFRISQNLRLLYWISFIRLIWIMGKEFIIIVSPTFVEKITILIIQFWLANIVQALAHSLICFKTLDLPITSILLNF